MVVGAMIFHLLDILLPADGHRGVDHRSEPRNRAGVRFAGPKYASLGRAPHGAVGVLAHEPRLLPRRVQVAT